MISWKKDRGMCGWFFRENIYIIDCWTKRLELWHSEKSYFGGSSPWSLSQWPFWGCGKSKLSNPSNGWTCCVWYVSSSAFFFSFWWLLVLARILILRILWAVPIPSKWKIVTASKERGGNPFRSFHFIWKNDFLHWNFISID